MAILREATRWRAPKASRGSDLTADEQARVKAALAFLAKRHGTYRALASAMGLKRATVIHANSKRGSVTAGVALRAARAAGAALEDVLTGALPKPGACPHCAGEGSAMHNEGMPKRSSKPKPDDDEDVNVMAHRILREATGEAELTKPEAPEKNPAAVALGRLGGLKGGFARAKKMSKKRRSDIAKKAARARWAKKP